MRAIGKKLAALMIAGALALPVAAQDQGTQTGGQGNQQQSSKGVKITNGPVLENVSHNQATVAWSTNVGSSSVVRYGTDPKQLSQTAQEKWTEGTHRVILRNLQPNTAYYFQVESDQARGSGAETKNAGILSFKTLGQGQRETGNVQPMLPVYRLYSEKANDHLYTTSPAERDQASQQGYRDEGVVGYIAPNPIQGTVELFRLAKDVNGQPSHFYTSDPQERQRAESQLGYRFEDMMGYVLKNDAGDQTNDLHRLVSTQGGQPKHFYTTDDQEAQRLTQGGQFKKEGVVGYIWAQPTRNMEQKATR